MGNEYTFQISLTILDHLGRNLYRSFSTVLGEAISNSWDADAKNVYIRMDKSKNTLFIIDDGIGMNSTEFQENFLKIGFSKRVGGNDHSPSGRPYIGRKGIGKLALLSCSERITVATKKTGGQYVGGTIDNKSLDEAVSSDLRPDQYALEPLNLGTFQKASKGHSKGTIIYLEGFKGGIKNTEAHLRKIIALYFKFSLIDPTFNIYLNDHKITPTDLGDLSDSTEFLWIIGNINDPYLNDLVPRVKEISKKTMRFNVNGFIASVKKPRHLTIANADERVSVDLFVNGRIRERNILRHIPTARIAESYFYGQIHFDTLEGDIDRFTSSREGVIAEDPLYQDFLSELRRLLLNLNEEWDDFRRKWKEDGDPESTRITMKQRRSEELTNVVANDYRVTEETASKHLVDKWIDELSVDSAFNISAYADCFLSENLIRNYIVHSKKTLSPEALKEAKKWKDGEVASKGKANISIEIRSRNDDLGYLDMDNLANLVEKVDKNNAAGLNRDAIEYKPIRNACAHTALLTKEGKDKLSAVYANIRARLKTLLLDMSVD